MPLLQKIKTAFKSRDLQIDVNHVGGQEWELEFEIPIGVDEKDLKFHGLEVENLGSVSDTVEITLQEKNNNNGNELKQQRKLKERLHRKRPEITLDKIDTAFEKNGDRIPLNSLETINKGYLVAQRKTIHPGDRLDVDTENISSLESEYQWTLKANYERQLEKKRFNVRITYGPENSPNSTYPESIDSTARFVSTCTREEPKISAQKEGNTLKITVKV